MNSRSNKPALQDFWLYSFPAQSDFSVSSSVFFPPSHGQTAMLPGHFATRAPTSIAGPLRVLPVLSAHAEVGEPLTHGVEVLVLIKGVERYP